MGGATETTIQLWTKLFPNMPYDHYSDSTTSTCGAEVGNESGRPISYDLVNAVMRQVSFHYQVVHRFDRKSTLFIRSQLPGCIFRNKDL